MKSVIAAILLIVSLRTLLADETNLSEIIGYASPKHDLLVPDANTVQFKVPRIGQHYDLLKQIDSGYLIPLERMDGSIGLALIPFRDEVGNRTVNPYEPLITFANIDGAIHRRGFLPLDLGKAYAVYSKYNGNLVVAFCCKTLTQTVTVAETNFSFVSLDDYTEVIASLTSSAQRLIAENASIERIASIFKNYSGKFAVETASEREELEQKYRLRAASDHDIQHEADQRAKGLVKYNEKWATPEEHANNERSRELLREQENQPASDAQANTSKNPCFEKGFITGLYMGRKISSKPSAGVINGYASDSGCNTLSFRWGFDEGWRMAQSD